MALKSWWDRDFPVATYSLIVFNVALFAALTGAVQDDVFRDYALTPSSYDLLQMFTSTFLHGSLFHLAANMAFLWLFGRAVERVLGSVEFFLFYIGSGFAASFMHLGIVFSFMPAEARVHHALGASGAIAGVLGLYAVRFYHQKFKVAGVELSASSIILLWVMCQVVLGITALYVSSLRVLGMTIDLSTVGYWAHLGGFIFGMGYAQMSHTVLASQKEQLLKQDSYRRDTLLDVAREYEDLTDREPHDPFAYAELGRTWGMLGEFDQSIPYYARALEMYVEEKREDLALKRLREMRSMWPDALLEPQLHFRLACLLENQERYQEAIDMLNVLVASGSRTGDAEMAALRVGEIYLSRLNRPETAVAAFKRFLRLFPDSEWCYFAEQALTKAGGKS